MEQIAKKFNFKRGLEQIFVYKLNEEYQNENSLWRHVTESKDLFVAIRDNYINVYFKGNSLLRIELNDKRITYSTHYKFLISKNFKPTYIRKIGESELEKHNITAEKFILADIKKASIPYSGIEKSGLHKIIQSNDNIIDCEIAFSNYAETENSRIDLTSLNLEDGAFKLCFYEAKHYNNPEIRKNETSDENIDIIKVSSQIDRYKKLIDGHGSEIIDGYVKVITNLKDLHGECFEKWNNFAPVEQIKLEINPNVKLIVFGFDDDQKNGKHFKSTFEKLERQLKKENVLKKGNPSGFTNGIKSSPPFLSKIK